MPPVKPKAEKATPRKGNTKSFEIIREQLHRQMLSAVSHDLKTPLATIIGSLEVYGRVGSKLTKEKQETLIGSALSEAYRLDNFITNILDMARLEGDMVTTRLERCHIPDLINDCITKLGPRRERCEITLTSIGDKFAQTDPMLFSRAISLVLENASKHAGKNPVIHIEYGGTPDGFVIHVRDNGPGIPPGKEEVIFSKYARFAKSDQQNAGTGLGLAISRELMRVLKGTISVDNHPEGGAVFTLSIP